MPHAKTRFSVRDVYRRKHVHAFHFAQQRYSFWVATVSLFAFVIGNMVGQHGLYAFWHSVLGKEDDSAIVFTGMVPPIEFVPDYVKWAQYGGDIKDHTYRMVPRDVLIPLPSYTSAEQKLDYEKTPTGDVYSIGFMGSYETGAEGEGSHVGIDIRVPIGTPVHSIANGIVDQVRSIPNGFGNYVVIRHPNIPDTTDTTHRRLKTVYSIYAHLDTMLVTEGMVVERGEQIGTSGQTGFATGPHLHFQIDKEDAPFHPYWPFTSTDADNAHLTFMGAINKGLKKENGYEYSLSPMELVQSYENFTVRVASTATTSTDALATSEVVMTPQERAAARRAMRANRTAMGGGEASSMMSSVSSAESAPPEIVVPQPAAPDSLPAQSSSSATTAQSSPVDHIEISHDGSYRRSWETMEVTTLDASGNVVMTPTFDGKIYLRAGFGDAEIRPSTLVPSDFHDGVATVHVLPFTRKKAFVIDTFGAFSVQAPPMEFDASAW